MLMASHIKHYHDQPEARHAKSILLYEASITEGGFRAPCPRAFDLASQATEFERISGASPLTEVLPVVASPRGDDLVAAAGRALASIHRSLTCIGGASVTWPPARVELRLLFPDDPTCAGLDWGEIDGKKPVLCHGDFGLGNLFVGDEPGEGVWVIDPEPAPFLGMPIFALASPYFDVAHFASCLEGIFPVRHFGRYDWRRVRARRRIFIDAYGAASGVVLDPVQVELLASCLLRAYVDWRCPRASLPYRWLVGRWLRQRARRLRKV
jgi:hypothetical protein